MTKTKKAKEPVEDHVECNPSTLIGFIHEIEVSLKEHHKLFNTLQKGKKKTSTTKKVLSGFNKQQPLPQKAKEFFEQHANIIKKHDDKFDLTSEYSRSNITKYIYHYIKEKQLYGMKDDNKTVDKKQIVPDKSLAKLFDLSKTTLPDGTTGYESFNSFGTMQKYVNKLYPPSASATTMTATESK